jgi:hypothetical protein
LTEAAYFARDFRVPAVGFDKHLNYIHRPNTTLTEEKAWGLAALYKSMLLGTYFRCISGKTKVNATALRVMPLPSREGILALIQRVKYLAASMTGLDDLVISLDATHDVMGCWLT